MRRTAGVGAILGVALACCFGLLVVSATPTSAQDGGVTVELVPANDTVQEDDRVTVDVVANGLDGGLQSANVTITTDDWEVARLADEEFTVDSRGLSVFSNQEGTRLSTDEVTEDVSGTTTIARLAVSGDEVGSASFGVRINSLVAADGSEYAVAGTTGTTVDVQQDGPGARVRLRNPDSRWGGDRTVGIGTTTYWNVAFADPDGGVRNATYTVSLSNASVASITGVDSLGSPASESVSIADDRASATVTATGANVTGGNEVPYGQATVGRVAVRADSPGDVELSVAVQRARNATGAAYRITGTESSGLTVVPRAGSAEISLEPEQQRVPAGEEATFDVVARNLTTGLSQYELHVLSPDRPIRASEDYEIVPAEDVERGGYGFSSGEDFRIQIRKIEGEGNRTEVTLGRFTVPSRDRAATVAPTLRPIHVLDDRGRAYDVGYVHLNGSESIEAAMDGGGSDAGQNGNSAGTAGGSGDLGIVVPVLGLVLGAFAAGLTSRRH